jgi:hypothetical protein
VRVDAVAVRLPCEEALERVAGGGRRVAVGERAEQRDADRSGVVALGVGGGHAVAVGVVAGRVLAGGVGA